MKNFKIPMSSPEIEDDDIKEVVEVLKSGRLALGPKAEEFEKLMCKYIGVKHAIVVNSGTAALHLIIKALNFKPGDEILVPSFTFASSINVILYENLVPKFIDIEPETYNIDPEKIRKSITSKTKGIMVVDIFGHPAEWDEIEEIAKEYNLKIIDDSCEALGSEYKNKKLGNFGNAAAFAFYPNKQITTGEGGMVVTNDDKIAEIVYSLRNQGRSKMGKWLQHQYLGYNYRITEMSAALGVSQLKKIEKFLKKREKVASIYNNLLKNYEWVKIPTVKPHVKMSWFVYVITLHENLERTKIMNHMQDLGIPTRGYFSPMHLQPYLKDIAQINPDELKNTESISKRTIALPFFNNLKEKQIKEVVEALKLSIDKYLKETN